MSVAVMILVQIRRNRLQPRSRYAIAVCIHAMASGAIMLKDSLSTEYSAIRVLLGVSSRAGHADIWVGAMGCWCEEQHAFRSER
jgi:hypothetical protein